MVGKSPTWVEKYCGWKATNSDMVGKSPTWLENYCGYKGETLKLFPYGWKKSDMVGKLQWMEGDKFQQGGKGPSGGEKRCSVT
jgi:hypothetical protein